MLAGWLLQLWSPAPPLESPVPPQICLLKLPGSPKIVVAVYQAQAGGGPAYDSSPRIHLAHLNTRSTVPRAPTTWLRNSQKGVMGSGGFFIDFRLWPTANTTAYAAGAPVPGDVHSPRTCEEGPAEDDCPPCHLRQPHHQHARRVQQLPADPSRRPATRTRPAPKGATRSTTSESKTSKEAAGAGSTS